MKRNRTEYMKQYYLENKEKIRAMQEKYRNETKSFELKHNIKKV